MKAKATLLKELKDFLAKQTTPLTLETSDYQQLWTTVRELTARLKLTTLTIQELDTCQTVNDYLRDQINNYRAHLGISEVNLTNLQTSYAQSLSKASEQIADLIEAKEKKAASPSWFAPRRWLEDAEIDWALAQVNIPNNYHILHAAQLHAQREVHVDESLAGILTYFTNPDLDLVLMPVNNPNFHWSLLVWERNSQTFHHYDTLGGANWNYIKPLVQTFCQQLQIPTTSFRLIHDTSQGNGYDCGPAIITIARNIITTYQSSNLTDVEISQLNFAKERIHWRNLVLKAINPAENKLTNSVMNNSRNQPFPWSGLVMILLTLVSGWVIWSVIRRKN